MTPDDPSSAQVKYLQDRITTLEMQLGHAINLRMEAQKRAYHAEKAVAEMTMERHRVAQQMEQAMQAVNITLDMVVTMYRTRLNTDVRAPGVEPAV